MSEEKMLMLKQTIIFSLSKAWIITLHENELVAELPKKERKNWCAVNLKRGHVCMLLHGALR